MGYIGLKEWFQLVVLWTVLLFAAVGVELLIDAAKAAGIGA